MTIPTAATLLGSASALPAAGQYLMYLPVVPGPRPFSATPTAATFFFVTDISQAGDGRLFIAERDGAIRILHPSGATSVFLDIREKVTMDGAELGLLGLTFSRNFAQDGYFFIIYTGTIDGPEDIWLILARYQVGSNSDIADPASETILFSVRQENDVHIGGGLEISPLDGALYLGVGDDRMGLLAQNMNSVKGKIIRLTEYDEPLAGGTNRGQAWLDGWSAVPAEVWLSGLRNPWRLTFGADGQMFIGDVGEQNWEEIDLVPAAASGLNFGWPCMEGPDVISLEEPCQNPQSFTLPIHAYPHTVGCAVIVGEMNPLNGQRLIFGDYCSSNIYSLAQLNGEWQAAYEGTLPAEAGFLTTFGADYQGKLYAGTESIAGPIYWLDIP